MEFNHISVLKWESIEGLNIKPDGIYVDCTLGGGGHSLEIAKRLEDSKTEFTILSAEESKRKKVKECLFFYDPAGYRARSFHDCGRSLCLWPDRQSHSPQIMFNERKNTFGKRVHSLLLLR